MSEEHRKVLEMLQEGKISIEQAEKLLSAIGKNDPHSEEAQKLTTPNKKPKFLRIVVNPGEGHRHNSQVNIKVPILLIKAGMKLGSVIPSKSKDKITESLKEKGIDIDVNNLDANSIDSFLQALGETSIDIEDEHETVKIFCE